MQPIPIVTTDQEYAYIISRLDTLIDETETNPEATRGLVAIIPYDEAPSEESNRTFSHFFLTLDEFTEMTSDPGYKKEDTRNQRDQYRMMHIVSTYIPEREILVGFFYESGVVSLHRLRIEDRSGRAMDHERVRP